MGGAGHPVELLDIVTGTLGGEPPRETLARTRGFEGSSIGSEAEEELPPRPSLQPVMNHGYRVRTCTFSLWYIHIYVM